MGENNSSYQFSILPDLSLFSPPYGLSSNASVIAIIFNRYSYVFTWLHVHYFY